MKRSIKLLAMLVLFAACQVKHKEDKNEVGTAEYLDKSVLTNKTFSLVRGIEDATNNDLYLIPGFSDDLGLVEARILEKELQFVAVGEPNSRSQTATVVASFPITDQFDIEKGRNDFGEETNVTGEKRELPWDSRKYIRVDWAHGSNKIAPTDNFILEMLGVGLSESSHLVEPLKVDGDHLSFLTETEVVQGSDASTMVRVKARTHLLERKKSDFVPVPYRSIDFSRFGYFYTRQNIDDPQKGLLDANVQRYANVHNVCQPGTGLTCSTNKIVWVLNEGFPEKFVESARRVVSEWNLAFKKSLGRQDDVVVLDESILLPISDPRANVIASYPHKAGGGLLGVAQFVTDNRTGEFIATRATVYEDGIQYELGLVDTYLDEVLGSPDLKALLETDGQGTTEKLTASDLKQMRSTLGIDKFKTAATGRMSLKSLAKSSAEAIKKVSIGRQNAKKLSALAKTPELFTISDFGAIANYLDVPNKDPMQALVSETTDSEKSRAEELFKAKMGIHSSEIVSEPIMRFIANKLREKGTIDKEAQRTQIKSEVEQLVFYTTLLHEMGHAFGLRHNFMGSADKRNYNVNHAQILQKISAGDTSLKPEDAAPFAYSSIMDYGSEFFDGAGGLGPYDQAAIAYAYNRVDSVQTRDKAFARKAKQEDYMFCTDNTVNESLLCRRFDEGSNVNQVIKAQVDRLQRNYLLTHFRRGRATFNSRLRSYLPNVYTNLLSVRQAMDELLYQLINSPQVSVQVGAKDCDQMFSYYSIRAGEIANICDGAAAESAGVQLNDLSTLSNGLFDPTTGKLWKDPATYVPGGLADLVMASLRAEKAFAGILGAPAPGVYLAEGAEGQTTLTALEGSNDEERLRNLADARNIEDVDAFVKENLGKITELKLGAGAKALDSKISTDGEGVQLDVLGYIYDKTAALYALGARNLHVRKYAISSMTANAYVLPQTKALAMSLVKKVINRDSSIANQTVVLRDGSIVSARVPADLNLDLQVAALEVSLLDFSTDQDTSILDKLRVCDSSDSGRCAKGLGPETVEMESASGQTKFTASQTMEEDSIVVPILKEGAKIAADRKTNLDLVSGQKDAIAANLEKLKSLAKLSDAILTIVKGVEEVKDSEREGLDSANEKSLVAVANLITTSVPEGQFYQSLELAQNKVNEVQGLGEKLASLSESTDDAEIKAKLGKAAKGVDLLIGQTVSVLQSDLKLIRAPVMVKRLTGQLEAKESTVRLIRRIMDETGQN